ncbi:MAG: steroid-24-oyl-CoA synthetase [Pseudonocardiales bacterium]|nr:steroid-24-oyl-CoA synthetase [Pseudonocardiales bacterium]
MSTSVDPAALAAEVRARLTGPGGPFELTVEDVRDIPMPVWKNRRHSVLDWLDESAALGEREYLVQGDRRLTYAEHRAAVERLAAVLHAEHGVLPGKQVAILAANSIEWVVAMWATLSLGAVVVAGNAWWTVHEAAHALDRAEPEVIIADRKRAKLVEGVGVDVLATDGLLQLRSTGDGGHPDGRSPTAEDDPAVVVYTSGTTGHPKGATHSHRNLLAVIEYHRYTDAAATAMAEAFGMPARTEPRRFLMSLPLFHIASLHNCVIPRLTLGDTVVIDDGPFDVERVFGVIERERITNWAVVPTMAHRVVENPALADYDLSSLAALSINSAPSSPALKDRVRAAIPNVQAAIADSYGLTESSTAATLATPMDLITHPTSVGTTIPSVALSVRDADGERVPDGEEGEIWLRSQFVMLGYWRDDEATKTAITPDGWLRTGDLGSVRDGRLYLATRRSDLILRGGENVYPAEIEAVLDEHAAVVECAVFGVDDADLGQAVAAIVVSDGADEDELRAFVADRLAYYKVPAHWRLTQTPLPRTATGKVIRTALSLSPNLTDNLVAARETERN